MRIATARAALVGAALLLRTPAADAQRIFRGTLSGASEVPPNGSTATGRATASLDGTQLTLTGSFAGLTSDYNTSVGSHIHQAPPGSNGPIIFALTPELDADLRGGRWLGPANRFGLSAEQVTALETGNLYVNVHSVDLPGGEIRADLAGGVALSEIRTDQTSTDNDEYFELLGPPGATLDSLTYVVIGDGSAALGSGVIEEALSLDGLAIPDDGFFVAAEGTFTLGTADATVSLNFENEESVTHLLVRGFTGDEGDDLDTDDDGVPDVAPWAEIVDAIGLADDEDDLAYGAALGYENLGPDGSVPPAHAYRARDTGAWVIGEFDLGVDDTPGAPNANAPVASEPPAPPPAALALEAAAPSPAMDHAMVTFALPRAAAVRLALYDALGREVAVLVDATRAAGTHAAHLDAAGLAPGVYVLRLEADGQAVTQTVPVVR